MTSTYKLEKTHVGTYVVRGPGLEGAFPVVWDDEASAMRCRIVLEHAYAAGLRARDVHEAGRHDPAMECVDASPAIRCTPATGAGLVLTIDPLDGSDCPTVNLSDVMEWLADHDPRPGAPLRGEDARRLVESLDNRCSPEEAARRIAWAKVASAEMVNRPREHEWNGDYCDECVAGRDGEDTAAPDACPGRPMDVSMSVTIDVLAPLRVAGVASKNRCDKAAPERVVEMATQRIVDLQREVTRLREAARQHAEAMHGKSVRRKLREVAGLLIQVRGSLGRDPPEAAGNPDPVPTTPSVPAPVQVPASVVRPFEIGDLVLLGPGFMPQWDGIVLRVVGPGQPVEVEGRTFGGLKSLGTFRAEQLRRAPASATFGEVVS